MPWTLLQELSAFQTRQGREPRFIRSAHPSEKPIPTFTPVFSEKCPATIGSNASQRGSGNAPQTLGSPNSVPKCYNAPPDEQAAIARFLDHADEQIQRYIAGKERLITLLEEERQALIHQAVTRGLDPNVRLRPSGVEWLEEVPEHWEDARFGQNINIAEGQVDPKIEPYSSMLMIAPNHVESGTGRLLQRETAYEQGAIKRQVFLPSW